MATIPENRNKIINEENAMLQKTKNLFDDDGSGIKFYTFEEILPFLKNGEFVRRAGWSDCFAIYMPLRYMRNGNGDRVCTPAVGKILLFEASRDGSTSSIVIGWAPHTRDFLATDWHCVDIIFKPRNLNPSYKPKPVMPIDNINDIYY